MSEVEEAILKELKEIKKLLKQSSTPQSGCNCGSHAGSFGAWRCPEHGNMQYDFDFGTVRKEDW